MLSKNCISTQQRAILMKISHKMWWKTLMRSAALHLMMEFKLICVHTHTRGWCRMSVYDIEISNTLTSLMEHFWFVIYSHCKVCSFDYGMKLVVPSFDGFICISAANIKSGFFIRKLFCAPLCEKCSEHLLNSWNRDKNATGGYYEIF